jgi:hypothetical protein
MTDMHERWLKAQRRRWTQSNPERFIRPDGHRYLRPDAERYLRFGRDRFLQPRARERKHIPAAPQDVEDAVQQDWEFERGVRRLRCDIADLKLQLALLRFGFRQSKAFDPNQPRVPAGNPDGGEWTSDGTTGPRIRLAGPLPIDDPPELPKERPPTSVERTGAIKEAARQLAKFGGPIAKIIGAAYWLYEYDAKIEASLDPPKSLEELQQAVATPKLGYHRHHIVEQTSAEQDGYPRRLIDGRDNLVRIPALKHDDISAWYSTKNKDFGGLSPRDYLRGKSWDRRREIGLDALRDHGVLGP